MYARLEPADRAKLDRVDDLLGRKFAKARELGVTPTPGLPEVATFRRGRPLRAGLTGSVVLGSSPWYLSKLRDSAEAGELFWQNEMYRKIAARLLGVSPGALRWVEDGFEGRLGADAPRGRAALSSNGAAARSLYRSDYHVALWLLGRRLRGS